MTTQNRNFPTLRFPEFQDEWKENTLSDIASRITVKNRDNSISFVLTNSATKGIISQQDYFDKDIANQNNLEGYYIVEKDDFVYNPRISANAPVGPIKRNKLAKGLMSPLYSVFRFKERNLDYFEQYFESVHWHKYLKSIANYGARHDRMNITVEDFFGMPFFLPSEEEKQKIASFLTTVNEKIQQLVKKKALLNQYKKGVMQKIFNQEIRFKNDNGTNFADWEEKHLGDVAKLYQPVTISQSQFTDEGYDVFGANGIIGKFPKFNHKQKQVTISCRGENSGQVNLTPPFCWITGNSMVANIEESKENILIDFFYYSLSSVSLKYLVTGSGQPQITRNNLTKHKFFLPEIIEQQKIANFLSTIDGKINLVDQQLEKTKEYKKGLLQQMFI